MPRETGVLPGDVLDQLNVFHDTATNRGFFTIVKSHFEFECVKAKAIPRITKDRLHDAYVQWQEDMERLSKHELKGKSPDEFKQAGHLAYWLRRCSPMYEVIDPLKDPQDTYQPRTSAEQEQLELIMRYGNEYLAFSLGFRIVAMHRCPVVDGTLDLSGVKITKDFVYTTCHFLKNKNVSPHALFLVYRSLFMS